MGWRDNLFLEGKGSFRGKEFFVDTVESSIGRRTVVHQFPGRDPPFIEDLGRDTNSFTFNAYVLGEDYMSDRNDLIREFTKGGPGPLVHPYWGTITVTVIGKVRIRETPNEGGMARLTITVVEVGNIISEGGDFFAPVIEADTSDDVAIASDGAVDSAVEQFVGVDVREESRADLFKSGEIPDDDAWTVLGVIEDVRDQALELGNEVVTLLNKINGYINSALNTADDIGALITDFSDSLATLILLPETFANQMEDLVSKIVGKIKLFEGIWNDFVEDADALFAAAATPQAIPSGSTLDTGSTRTLVLLKVFEDFKTFGDDIAVPLGSTPMQLITQGNRRSLISVMKEFGLLEICKAIIDIPFASYDAAVDVRDLLSDELDAVADVGGDLSYASLMDLRTSIVRHLTGVASDLPRINDYTPATQLPALVVAQHLYGDSRRDVDIIARNNLRNPAIIQGGTTLEVLSDE